MSCFGLTLSNALKWNATNTTITRSGSHSAKKSPSEFIVPFVISSTNSTYAPMYWGCIASTILFGVIFMQASTYFSRNSDSWVLRSLVSLLLFLDIAQSGFMTYTVYYLFVIVSGNVEVFSTIQVSRVIEALITAVITFIVQVFFATRIYLVTRELAKFYHWRKIIPVVIVVLALGSLVSATTFNTMAATTNLFQEVDKPFEITRCLEEGLSTLSDIITTYTLCFVITSEDSRQFWSVPYIYRSQSLQDRGRSPFRWLFFFLLTRGVLVTIIQTSALAAFMCAIWTSYWVPLHYCKSKVYTNMLLMMLNSRVQTPSEVSGTPVMPQLATQDIAARIAEFQGHENQERTDPRGQASDAIEIDTANADDNRHRFVIEGSVV